MAHFAPPRYAHFNPPGVVYYARFLQDDYTIKNSLNNVIGVDYSQLETEISNDISFQPVKNQLTKLITISLEFFNDFSNLEQVFKYIESKSIMEMVNFVGQPLPVKRMIIKKLANDENYDFYVQSLLTIFSKENETELLNFTTVLKGKLNELY